METSAASPRLRSRAIDLRRVMSISSTMSPTALRPHRTQLFTGVPPHRRKVKCPALKRRQAHNCILGGSAAANNSLYPGMSTDRVKPVFALLPCQSGAFMCTRSSGPRIHLDIAKVYDDWCAGEPPAHGSVGALDLCGDGSEETSLAVQRIQLAPPAQELPHLLAACTAVPAELPCALPLATSCMQPGDGHD